MICCILTMLWNVDDIILYFVPHNLLIPFGRPSNRVTRPCPICILRFPSGFAWWKNNISTKTFFVYTIERNIYCLFSLEQHFTSISPSRTFTDGENIELQCAVGGLTISNSTVEFICHGQRVYQNLESSVGAVTLYITIDVDYNGTKCVCTAVDGNSRVKTEIDLDIIIQCEY